jgi:ethanolamine utilization protein EutA (predicted chaperonin)
MRKRLALVLVLVVGAGGLGVLAASCGADNESVAAGHSATSWTAPERTTTDTQDEHVDTDEAIALIDDCRVGGTVSLHSGLFYLELRSGQRVTVDEPDEDAINAAVQRAQPDCGNITIAME